MFFLKLVSFVFCRASLFSFCPVHPFAATVLQIHRRNAPVRNVPDPECRTVCLQIVDAFVHRTMHVVDPFVEGSFDVKKAHKLRQYIGIYMASPLRLQ